MSRIVGHRRWATVLLAFVLLLAVTMFVVGGVWGSGAEGYAIAHAAHAPLFAMVLLVASGGGILAVSRTHGRKATAAGAVSLIVIACTAALYGGVLWSGSEQVARVHSPDGTRTLVVHPLEARVESGQGPTRRFVVVDCTNGDDGFFDGGRWLDDGSVVIATDGREGVPVRLEGSASAQETPPPSRPCGG